MMTLIEGREVVEPRISGGKRPQDTSSFPDESSGSDDEFLIANDEGYSGGVDDDVIDDGENNNSPADFPFSLPQLGLNYFNNLNLHNLNLGFPNLRNSPHWLRNIYENSSFTKKAPGFLSNYLGKHHSEHGDLDDITNDHDDDINTDSRYFTFTNFLRRHGFPLNEEEYYSEEAILERVRFKKLQQQAHQQARNRKLSAVATEETNKLKNSISLELLEVPKSKHIFSATAPADYHQDNLKKIDTLDCQISPEKQVKVGEEIFTPADLNLTPEVEVSSIGSSRLQCDVDRSIQQQHQQEMKKNVHSTTLNPFYSRIELSFWDKVKIAILTCTILPIKVVMMTVVLCIALILVVIGMYGVTFEESQSRPFPRWRRWVRWVIAKIVMRSFVFCSGFIWSIKETGKRATPEEAPIFVVGPHSSYFDSFVVILMGAPSVVAKMSTKDIPVFGRLVTFTQAVYVSRESKGSRKQTMEVLKQRAQDVYSGSGMPQIFIFPEGTCSNRSSLIKFKPGAFVPQVPVQPVLIRYPNRFDCCTWTFDGPPVVRNIWFAFSQLFNKIEVEYLPVYVPNESEKNDPALFAENVRKVMGKALNVPLSDYQFEDGTLLCTMRESKLVQKFRSIHRAKKALGLSGSTKECSMLLEEGTRESFLMGFYEFQRDFFHVSSEDTVVPEVQAAFNSFKRGDVGKGEDQDAEDEEEKVDVRPYLVLTCILYDDSKMMGIQDVPRTLCWTYGREPTEVEMRRLVEELFEVGSAENEGGCSKSTSQNQIIETETRISRILDFVKLFADEVTERLPKVYPGREERDKLVMPTSKGKFKSE